MKKLILILFVFSAIYNFAFIKKVEKIDSNIMNKKIPVTVILPDSYTENAINGKKYSVIYGLHGWGGSFRSFGRSKRIEEMADKYDIIYVFPDGNWNSWYIDSEIKKDSKYSTFISKELIVYIDKNYSTYKNRKQRAITGFSMGGFGAFYNGINNPEVFGNIGVIAGGVNVEKFKNKWGISKVIENNWNKYNIKDIIHMLDKNLLKKLQLEMPNIIIDCGNKDFFLESNREVHNKLLEMNIEHTYMERLGKHNKKYWVRAMEIQTEFFSNKFKEALNEVLE